MDAPPMLLCSAARGSTQVPPRRASARALQPGQHTGAAPAGKRSRTSRPHSSPRFRLALACSSSRYGRSAASTKLSRAAVSWLQPHGDGWQWEGRDSILGAASGARRLSCRPSCPSSRQMPSGWPNQFPTRPARIPTSHPAPAAASAPPTAPPPCSRRTSAAARRAPACPSPAAAPQQTRRALGAAPCPSPLAQPRKDRPLQPRAGSASCTRCRACREGHGEVRYAKHVRQRWAASARRQHGGGGGQADGEGSTIGRSGERVGCTQTQRPAAAPSLLQPDLRHISMCPAAWCPASFRVS